MRGSSQKTVLLKRCCLNGALNGATRPDFALKRCSNGAAQTVPPVRISHSNGAAQCCSNGAQTVPPVLRRRFALSSSKTNALRFPVRPRVYALLMDEIARQMALLKFYLAWSRAKSQSLLERCQPTAPRSASPKERAASERDLAQADERGDELLRVGHC